MTSQMKFGLPYSLSAGALTALLLCWLCLLTNTNSKVEAKENILSSSSAGASSKTGALATASSSTTGTVAPIKSHKDSVRVAVAQMQIDFDTLQEGETAVDALVPWIEQAVAQQADLVVFPEYLLGNFHLPNKLTDQLCAVAKQYDLNIVVGGWEYLPGAPIVHPPEDKTYANTILVVDRNGKIAGKHRKMHSAVGSSSPYCWPPNPGEKGENTMVKGEGNGVVELDFGRIGLLTCYDGYFFESFQMPSLRGAEVLIWVNARQGMVEPHVIQAASFITCTHVVASNQSMGCGSAICSYPGWKLDAAAPELGSETLIVAELDLAALRQQRLNNRMFHQRRPEIYGPLTQPLKPWEAYPHLKPFQHESAAVSTSSDPRR